VEQRRQAGEIPHQAVYPRLCPDQSGHRYPSIRLQVTP
jgi:hypothetical protein